MSGLQSSNLPTSSDEADQKNSTAHGHAHNEHSHGDAHGHSHGHSHKGFFHRHSHGDTRIRGDGSLAAKSQPPTEKHAADDASCVQKKTSKDDGQCSLQ